MVDPTPVVETTFYASHRGVWSRNARTPLLIEMGIRGKRVVGAGSKPAQMQNKQVWSRLHRKLANISMID